MQKQDVVKHILRNISHGSFVNADGGSAFAPSNVALCKYWGKRDQELNLPFASSLSISLGNKGAFTKIKQNGGSDKYFVNGEIVNSKSKFAARLKKFLDLFRPRGAHYLIEVDTNVPIAAGFASSACGFASLVKALNNLYNWRLDKNDLSILARLGSGSACRSIYEGFVKWQKGEEYNGLDSYAVKLDYIWPELRIGMLTVSTQQKTISSTAAMQLTVETSPRYADWIDRTEQDLETLKLALERKDFMLFGEVVENNAIAMHETMNSAQPPIIYFLPETIEAITKVQMLRRAGIPVFFTQDAGPNIQLIFLAKNETEILKLFPELDVVIPFSDAGVEKIILVDENDVETGIGEKLAVHVQGKLHRAFSVFVLRDRDGRLEILLQQRSAVKYHSANLWTNSCCGHPRQGENIVAASERRLQEEMGFTVPLKEIGVFHYKKKFDDVDLTENEIDHVLIGFCDLDEFPFNPAEVQDFCWVDLEDLLQDVQESPQKYTVWLPHALGLLAERSY